MRKWAICLVIMALSGCAAAGRSYNAEWPLYDADGARRGSVDDAPRPPLKQRWAFQTEGRIVAAPAVMDNTVYFGSRDSKIYALALDTGAKLWDAELEQGGIFGQPAVTPDFLFGGKAEAYYYVYGWERTSGKDLWSRQSGELINRPPWVLADSLRLYTHFDPPLNSPESVQVQITALNPQTGANLWQTPIGGIPNVSPALSSELLLVASSDSRLRALDKATGALRWEGVLDSRPASAPLVQGGRVYVSSSEGFLYAFHLADGKLAWRHQFPQTQLQGDLAMSGKLLLVPGIKGLYTFDTGELAARWTYRTPMEITAPAASATHVYFGCANHLLYVLRLENGSIAGSYRLPDEIIAPPVLAGGLVLVGASDGKLYAFEENEPAQQQQPRTQNRPPSWMQNR